MTKHEGSAVASSADAREITDALARQGYCLPSERARAVAEATADLAGAARGLEDGLPFTADLFGFATLLAAWRNRP